MQSRRVHLSGEARVEVSDASFEDLERAYEEYDEPGRRAELIGGRLLMSPTASFGHSLIVDRLIEALWDVKQSNGWALHPNLGLYSAATRDRMVPDLMVTTRDAPLYDQSHVYGHGVLLAAEVISPGSAADDTGVKPNAYARAGVPIMLLIDPLPETPVVTLLAGPTGARYETRTVAPQGKTLDLPAPFSLTIDTAALFS